MTDLEIIKRLRELQQTKMGDPWPEWLPPNAWGEPLSKLAGAAADRLEDLKQAMDAIAQRRA